MDPVNSIFRSKNLNFSALTRSHGVMFGENTSVWRRAGLQLQRSLVMAKRQNYCSPDLRVESTLKKRRVYGRGHMAARDSSEKGASKVVSEEIKKDKDALQVQLQLRGNAEANVLEEEKWQWPPWKQMKTKLQVAERYKLIGLTSLAFVICNMDKVNLSVAIIPMSHEFGWNASTAGLVQSSFFWGYALSQLPGGWLAKQLTGRRVLQFGVLGWSLATGLVPLVAGFMPGLIATRILVGIGEGVSPAAATELIARTIPITERSRAVAFVFSGLSVGSVLGLLFAPSCIENFGWESVFYIFGLLGLLWFVGFQIPAGKAELAFPGQTAPLIEKSDKNMVISENNRHGTHLASSTSVDPHAVELNSELGAVPWKAFLKSRAVWAMIYVHFCGNWGHYTFLSWLPTYFSDELQLDLTNAALVRKLCQTIAFISPAICMTISSVDLGLSPWTIVAVLTTGLALSSFALSGLYCTHQDISPEYASILLGLTSTAGAFPGIIGVALTGYLLDQTHSWSLALFAPAIFFYLTGTVVWLAFASSKPHKFLS
uniref:Major facilitator superfamily (MFS) profile domain-containing protein n=1 Tax=Araucaria cunninghamii TaxID=56994 RepID=A0A0D6QVX7_ARACU